MTAPEDDHFCPRHGRASRRIEVLGLPCDCSLTEKQVSTTATLEIKIAALEEVAFDIFDSLVGHPDFDPYGPSRELSLSSYYVAGLAVALCSVEPVSAEFSLKGHPLPTQEDGEMFLREWYEAKKEKFYSHVRPEVRSLAERGQRVSWAEYEALGRMNSYERKVLIKNLDDDALCRLYSICAQNSTRELSEFELAHHYGDVIERELAPLLAQRLTERAALADRVVGPPHVCGEEGAMCRKCVRFGEDLDD